MIGVNRCTQTGGVSFFGMPKVPNVSNVSKPRSFLLSWLLAPLFDFRSKPFPFAGLSAPCFTSFGEWREYPAPFLSVALVGAAHLTKETTEFVGGEELVSWVLVLRIVK